MWSAIHHDDRLGFHLTRANTQTISNMAKLYLGKLGLWDEFARIRKQRGNLAEFLFRKMGHECDDRLESD